MFTGIVEEIASIIAVQEMDKGRRLRISAKTIAQELKLGDSVAVDGVCLTVVEQGTDYFDVECCSATLQKTQVAMLQKGAKVNLERSLSAISRFDGHIVQGHVRGKAIIEAIERQGESYFLHLALPPDLLKDCVPEGSIAINGVSMTIAYQSVEGITVNIVPYTWAHTTFQYSHTGDTVNIETDIVARYIGHFFEQYQDRLANCSCKQETSNPTSIAEGAEL